MATKRSVADIEDGDGSFSDYDGIWRQRIQAFNSRKDGPRISSANIKYGANYKAAGYIPTGVKEVDDILEDGKGIPRGSLVEFNGKSGSGKTWLGLKLIASAQKLGGRACLLNVENTFFPKRAESIGVDCDGKVQGKDGIWRPSLEIIEYMGYGEAWIDVLVMLLETGEYDVIVVDSIKAMATKDRVEKGAGEAKKFAGHASMIEDMNIKAMPLCAKTGTICVLINQMRIASVQSGFQTKYIQSAAGGAAMEYYTHMRLWINKIYGKAGMVIGVQDGVEKIVGGKSKLQVIKTRFDKPNRQCDFPIMFGDGEGNALATFVFTAIGSKITREYVVQTGRGVNRTYKMLDITTGEILASGHYDWEFVQALTKASPPSKMPRGVVAENAFEYLCNRLKIETNVHDAIIDKMVQYLTGEISVLDGDDDDDENVPVELDGPDDTGESESE